MILDELFILHVDQLGETLVVALAEDLFGVLLRAVELLESLEPGFVGRAVTRGLIVNTCRALVIDLPLVLFTSVIESIIAGAL